MANTEHMGWPLPDTADDIDEEFFKLRDLTLPSIDAAVHALVVAVAAKAAADHGHQIGDITGLVQALAGKMAADATFALADLSDVAGADDAPSGYVVVKDGTGFRVMSLAAAIGEGIPMSLVLNLNNTLGQLANAIAGKAATIHTHQLATIGGIDLETNPPVDGNGLVYKNGKFVPGPAGGGMFAGSNGVVGDRSGDIFRVNDASLTASVTIPAGKNASAAGPTGPAVGVTLTIGDGATLTII